MQINIRLLIVPILLGTIGFGMIIKMFPLYSGAGIYNADPAYAYLFNGLLLLDFRIPFHIDHPGTPLQAIIAIVVYFQGLYLQGLKAIDSDVIAAAIASPERFLLVISRVLLALNVLATLFLGIRVYKNTKSASIAVLCQCSVLTFGLLGTKLLYPAPEAFLACLSLNLLAVLAPLIFQNNISVKAEERTALLAGFIFGLGFATKLTFLPMLGLLFLIQNKKNLAKACAAACLAWLLGILPILGKLPALWDWIYNMLVHVGKYGGGNKGLIDSTQITVHLRTLVDTFPLFYLSLLVFAGFLIYSLFQRRIEERGRSSAPWGPSVRRFKVILIFFVICFLQTLIVLKHFAEHYMIPALPIAFVGIAFLMNEFNKEGSRKFARILFFLVALAGSLFIIKTNLSTFAVLKNVRIQHNQSINQIEAELAKHQNPLVLGSYGCYLRQCGLLFGIQYAPALDKKIGGHLSNFYGFNVWNRMLVIDGHGFYPLTHIESNLERHQSIFLLTQLDLPAFDVFQKDLVLTAGDQKLFRVLGLASTEKK
jgi:hypothetical protein